LLVAASLLALCGAAGCTSDDCDQARPVGLATFNLGLAAGDVDYVRERVQPVADALAAADLDVLCVQEVWDSDDWLTLVEAAGDALPNHLRTDPLADCASGCTAADTDPVRQCADPYCAGQTGELYLTCAYDNCPDEVNQLGAVNSACLSCLLSEAGDDPDATPDELVEHCSGASGQGDNAYLYDCAYDTGLLTRGTILAEDSLPLDSFMVASAVEYARIDTGSGELDVFCAHLQSEMGFEYGGEHESYEEEQYHQISQLLGFISARSDGSRPVVLMGDLNTGPTIPADGLVGEWPSHYRRLLDAGFSNPYQEQGNTRCTLCPESSFRSDDSDPRLIDHILVQGARSDLAVTRFMNETITIEPSGGDPVETHYSDHFGLKATLGPWCVE
jgi:endonuclease/exonuclease/phosphatase family metal-dependent hydrolase